MECHHIAVCGLVIYRNGVSSHSGVSGGDLQAWSVITWRCIWWWSTDMECHRIAVCGKVIYRHGVSSHSGVWGGDLQAWSVIA